MVFVPLAAMPAPFPEQPLWFVCHRSGVLLRADAPEGMPPAALLPTTDEVRALGLLPASAQPLGLLDGTACLALGLEGDGEPAGPFAPHGLRKLWGRLPEALFAVAGRATQIVDWAQTHRFCGRCATPTVQDPRERNLKCPRCGLSGYPRISPAVIVLVRRGEEALLARSSRFPAAFFSTLAGFVEVGETLEETLAREVREEVGVEVARPRYFGSQPWPFPHSLMLGFTADYAGGELRPDGEEILEARWFRATDLPLVPPRLSIARRLIDAWVDEVNPRRE